MKNDTAIRHSIGSAMKNQYLRFALLATLTVAVVTALAQQSEAQILNKLRGDYGGDSLIQYSPDDASTRSRLFNLQTGQAGAFYNCDGEEDKRHSPYICWKNGPCGEKFHCALLDVLDWRRDKSEIAQRICDGAGACCNGGNCQAQSSTVISTPKPCGCAECLAAKSGSVPQVALAESKTSVSLLQRAHANVKGKPQFLQSKNNNVAGLATNATRSVLDKVTVQSQPCNCAQCKAKRATRDIRASQVATKAPDEEPIAKSRSASLLDRARSSRKQR